MWHRLKFSIRKKKLHHAASTDKIPLELQTNLSGKFNVNEEYKEAFRTHSYTEIWTKIHGQLGRTSAEQIALSPFPTNDFSNYNNLLEPQNDAILAMTNGANLHGLIIDYFDSSLEAFRVCCLLLDSINQTRRNYLMIRRALSLAEGNSDSYDAENQHRLIFNELVEFARLDNPFSGPICVQFGEVHDLYHALVGRLTNANKKVNRMAKVIRTCRKASAISLVFACGALSIVVIVLSAHTIVGIMILPVFLSSTSSCLTRSYRSVNKQGLAKLGAQLDAAAKGAYTLDRHFDTMSRLVTRLDNEIEHKRALIEILLRNQKGNLLKQVVKELENSQACFLEQLKELEEHVYLCFVTINRARTLVIQEVLVHQHRS